MDLFESIQTQIRESSRMLSTKAELISYYQAEYPARGKRGVESWRQHLQNDLAPISGISAKNLARRFDPSRRDNPGRAQEQLEYQELGEQIGPVAPEHGYMVTWHGEIRISNMCVPRTFGPLLIEGDDARELTSTGDVFIIFRVYFQGLDMAEGWCGSPEITIEPAGKGQTQMAFAHGPQGGKLAALRR